MEKVGFLRLKTRYDFIIVELELIQDLEASVASAQAHGSICQQPQWLSHVYPITRCTETCATRGILLCSLNHVPMPLIMHLFSSQQIRNERLGKSAHGFSPTRIFDNAEKVFKTPIYNAVIVSFVESLLEFGCTRLLLLEPCLTRLTSHQVYNVIYELYDDDSKYDSELDPLYSCIY